MKLRWVKDDPTFCPTIDRVLLKDLATTLFNSPQGAAVYAAYATREEAAAVEESLAIELASIYQQVKQRQADPTIQRLNHLLS